jgi:dimethylargininase
MMGERFTSALVRPPNDSYAGCLRPDGVTMDSAKARIQHTKYVKALWQIGVEVGELHPLDLPDSVFIEDTAVVLDEQVVLARPGAMTRRQEIITVADYFEEEGREVVWLEAGTLDGGDILRVGGYVLIGLSQRTDAAGAEAMERHVQRASMTPLVVPVEGRIHLKTSCSTLDAVTILATAATDLPNMPGVRVLRVPEGEEPAANCVAFRRSVILPLGYPKTEAGLVAAGFTPVPIDLSEFEKGGGGATCLSIRY